MQSFGPPTACPPPNHQFSQLFVCRGQIPRRSGQVGADGHEGGGFSAGLHLIRDRLVHSSRVGLGCLHLRRVSGTVISRFLIFMAVAAPRLMQVHLANMKPT